MASNIANLHDIMEDESNIYSECNYYSYEDIAQIDFKESDLNVLHINIHSILANKTQLTELIEVCNEAGHQIDALLICETFMNENNKSQCKIKNYNMVAYEYRQTTKQGGVAIYLRKGLKYTNRKDLTIYKEGEFESCFTELLTEKNRKNVIIGEIYRVPGKPEKQFLSDYEQLLDTISKENKNIIIGTDQNIDYLKINENTNASLLYDLNLQNSLIPTISRPTRITHTSATLIDNINISITLSNKCKSAIIICDISDHYPCLTMISKCGKTHDITCDVETRRLNTLKLEKIKTKLYEHNWDNLNHINANEAYNEFESTLISIINNIAPRTCKKIKHNNINREPWMTPGLMKASKKANKLYNNWANTGNKDKNHALYASYKTYRNNYNSIKRKAKFLYIHNQINEYKNNGKKLWKIINGIIGKCKNKQTCIDYININGIRTYNNKLIADHFCTFFSDIGSTLANHMQQSKNPSMII